MLSRVTLNAPPARPATAVAEALRPGADGRWPWAVVAACFAALFYLLAQFAAGRRAHRPKLETSRPPSLAKAQAPRRPVFKPGPPPPRVTVLASARR